jgi:two-component system, NarL family, response regulator LiaR
MAGKERLWWTKPRVILADDDPLARRVVRAAIELSGIVVIAEASSGREAVELARHYKPDVVLMDAVMPELDGMEATRKLASAAPETKVIMLTRSEDEELGLLALEAGAVGYLTKDVSDEAICRAIRGVHAGEAAISRRLSRRLVERMQELPQSGIGVRPVRSRLTPREWEVLDLLCVGKTTAQVAEQLVLSTDTVRSHIRSVLRKLDVHSQEEAIELAAGLRYGASA